MLERIRLRYPGHLLHDDLNRIFRPGKYGHKLEPALGASENSNELSRKFTIFARLSHLKNIESSHGSNLQQSSLQAIKPCLSGLSGFSLQVFKPSNLASRG
eukprot:g69992.t1